jgi:hypothetical protein
VQERLRTELHNHLPNFPELATYEKIEGITYLDHVCREVLRFVPPGKLLKGDFNH